MYIINRSRNRLMVERSGIKSGYPCGSPRYISVIMGEISPNQSIFLFLSHDRPILIFFDNVERGKRY